MHYTGSFLSHINVPAAIVTREIFTKKWVSVFPTDCSRSKVINISATALISSTFLDRQSQTSRALKVVPLATPSFRLSVVETFSLGTAHSHRRTLTTSDEKSTPQKKNCRASLQIALAIYVGEDAPLFQTSLWLRGTILIFSL